MKGKYKRASEYCPGCDMSFLALGKKCPYCGYRSIKKLPKPSKHKILEEEIKLEK